MTGERKKALPDHNSASGEKKKLYQVIYCDFKIKLYFGIFAALSRMNASVDEYICL